MCIRDRDVVRVFANNCVAWLNKEYPRMNSFERSSNGRLSLSLLNCRRYLDNLLYSLVDEKVGINQEVDLGHYHLTSSEDKSSVVIKRSSRKLPRSPSSYIGWTDWDINQPITDEYGSFVRVIYTSGFTWYKSNCPLTRRISLCLLYTSPSPRDLSTSRMPSSA